VLQALNHRDLIKRIDYLSTVSGGGYIGSSLTASICRQASLPSARLCLQTLRTQARSGIRARSAISEIIPTISFPLVRGMC
jgi:hypothetical protein